MVLKGEVLQKFGNGGVGDFIFGKLPVIVLIFQDFVHLSPAQPAAGGCSPLKVTSVRGPPQAKILQIFGFEESNFGLGGGGIANGITGGGGVLQT